MQSLSLILTTAVAVVSFLPSALAAPSPAFRVPADFMNGLSKGVSLGGECRIRADCKNARYNTYIVCMPKDLMSADETRYCIDLRAEERPKTTGRFSDKDVLDF